MVVDYVNSKTSGYTVNMIVDYCISKTKYLDNGDEKKIDRIVYDTLEQLREARYVSSRGDWYKTQKTINFADCFITVEDKVHPMQITKKRVDAVNNIDLYSNFLINEDESEL